jgi:hypothetical protein
VCNVWHCLTASCVQHVAGTDSKLCLFVRAYVPKEPWRDICTLGRPARLGVPRVAAFEGIGGRDCRLSITSLTCKAQQERVVFESPCYCLVLKGCFIINVLQRHACKCLKFEINSTSLGGNSKQGLLAQACSVPLDIHTVQQSTG